MKTFYTVQAIDNNHILREKIMIKKLKKTVAGARQNQYGLHKNLFKVLQKNAGKQYIFNTQLTHLIDTVPDAILFKDRAGRKLITNQLTKRLFKQHELDWYGKAAITPVLADHEYGRMLLESDLHLALAKRQLKLYYQIQVDGNRKMLGAEALLRWEHPQYGVIIADQFITIAEQTGLILPIGAWVLQTACEQLKRWQSDPLKKNLSLAVNISPSQFSQPEFVEQLRRILEKTGIDAAGLKLELTESLMLHDIANTIEKMEALKLLGIRFSMDNFGKGYSTLSQLKKLPIDQLKIDEYLMRDIVIDSCDAMIVKTIIDMTRNLGVDVIAEGMETEQQFSCLKPFGCSAFQGYLFGKPMPLKEFEAFISQADRDDGAVGFSLSHAPRRDGTEFLRSTSLPAS
ncbi:MAG: putative bifunctional diguanylate cyclase/phosphodiesterase [Methylobacter sp.]